MTTENSHPARQRIVVLGGGYAGLAAALRLAPHHRVTLADPRAHFVERVRLHELAAGSRASVGHAYETLLAGTGVTHVRARAVGIDLAARRVRLDHGGGTDGPGGGTDGPGGGTDDHVTAGTEVEYDRLVYALGSRTASPGGARVYTAETAAGLAAALSGRPGGLAVVGGGLTGIEMAAELAEAHPEWRIRLLTAGRVGPDLSGRGRAHVRAALARLGVRVEEGTAVESPDAIDADVVVWASAMAANTGLAAEAGLELDASGRVRVDEALRSVSHPEVVVAGDACAGLRMACATAMPTGSQAAGTLLREARGDRPGPLRFRYWLKCVSLGRGDGLIQVLSREDEPRDLVLTGRAAAWVKEQVVRSTVRTLRFGARHPAAIGRVPGLT
ncbi:NAD(P)/FAD-dependent oxidoreductase [Planobispora longispora]|uniref:NADH dehydrogenase n=1 Tax=Planobispora longispora TaxID=28887 RepID=A0A8J3RJG5_9ACTN|nr:FAD-dependent oxidoreductase [Planobispora longispora]GIH76005.1 NADH dehydrogenase [Planobispora longispora]